MARYRLTRAAQADIVSILAHLDLEQPWE